MSRYPRGKEPTCPNCQTNKILDRESRQCAACHRKPGWYTNQPAPERAPVALPPSTPDDIIRALKKGPQTLINLGVLLRLSPGAVLDQLLLMQQQGMNVQQIGDKYTLEAAPLTNEQTGKTFEYRSRPDNHFLFGAVADSHLGSKWERLDVLNDLYDRFAAAGVDRVYHAGNWIDGENQNNKFDVHVHGMEEQVRYLVEKYPQRPGITTYAVAGEDHEGFYCRRESIDIGRYAERLMRDAGRTDWVDLGFIEAKVDLVNAHTGKRGSMLVMHPGGGSAYALSYKAQKILESLEGGEKPSVLLIGHYHKLSMNLIRNVWAVQLGATQDQTVFMRKKNLESHVGGVLIDLEQDPETGAIIGCTPTFLRYFNADYYNDRWAKVGPVQLPVRRLNRPENPR